MRYTRAPCTGGFANWGYPGSWQHTTAVRTTISGIPVGFDYCFSVRSRDRAGNLSPWSVARCSARLVDDRALSAGAGWVRATSSGFFARTYTATTRAGATLTRSGALIERIGLLATVCPRCGKIGIYLNGRLFRTVNLYSRTTHRQVLFTFPAFSYRKATVTLKVLTSGRTIQIDGLALSRS